MMVYFNDGVLVPVELVGARPGARCSLQLFV